MEQTHNRGFSLVELLVALIAISCIIAAFAPVITKKTKSNIGVKGSKDSSYDGVLFTYDPSDPSCEEVAGITSLSCNFKVPDGVTKINAVLIGGGGGGGGSYVPQNTDGTETKTIFDTKASILVNTNTSKYKNRTPAKTFYFDKVEGITIDFMTGGGGGGSGAFWYSSRFPQSTRDCELVAENDGVGGVMFIPNKKIDNTKGFSIPHTACLRKNNASVNLKETVHGTCSDFTKACCFKGETSSSCDSDTCNKHVCNRKGAKDACAQLGSYWSLPSEGFWDKFFNTGDATRRIQIINSGLKLCANKYPTNTDVRYFCETFSGACGGKSCIPSFLWDSASAKDSGDQSFWYMTKSGSLAASEVRDPNKTFASTKCHAYQFDNHLFMKYASGYGGVSSAFLQNYSLPKTVIDELNKKGGSITISAGVGGEGGKAFKDTLHSSAPINDTSKNITDAFYFAQRYNNYQQTGGLGGNGGATTITISAKTGGTIKIEIPGGSGGLFTKLIKDASFGSNFDNTGYSGEINNSCNVTSTGTLSGKISFINCSRLSGSFAYGLPGESIGDTEYATTSQDIKTYPGGQGAGSAYNAWDTGSGSYYGGGVAATKSNYTAYKTDAPIYPGAGGAGGSMIGRYDTNRSSVLPLDGQKGAGGFAQVSVQIPVTTYSGGGGGGASLFVVENLEVTPGKIYNVLVGKGGKGGKAAYIDNGTTVDAECGSYGSESKFFLNASGYDKYTSISSFGAQGGSPATKTAGGAGGSMGYHQCYAGTCNAVSEGKNGEDGSSMGIGGAGGASGTGSLGGCGGANLYSHESCIGYSTALTTDGSSPYYTYPGKILNKEYGEAGAGGGGGGWTKNYGSGDGGDGAHGYVYIYWKK